MSSLKVLSKQLHQLERLKSRTTAHERAKPTGTTSLHRLLEIRREHVRRLHGCVPRISFDTLPGSVDVRGCRSYERSHRWICVLIGSRSRIWLKSLDGVGCRISGKVSGRVFGRKAGLKIAHSGSPSLPFNFFVLELEVACINSSALTSPATLSILQPLHSKARTSPPTRAV